MINKINENFSRNEIAYETIIDAKIIRRKKSIVELIISSPCPNPYKNYLVLNITMSLLEVFTSIYILPCIRDHLKYSHDDATDNVLYRRGVSKLICMFSNSCDKELSSPSFLASYPKAIDITSSAIFN